MKVFLTTLSTLSVAFGAIESGGLGWPTRDPQLDALPEFKTPPRGYGEVPFWWWTGEELDVDRLIWQVRELHKKGISGVQVNYSHTDTEGWPTDFKDPALFTEDWWKIYSTVSEECGKLDMGIGLSTYTLDWPRGGQNLFLDLFYSKPKLNAYEIQVKERKDVKGGQTVKIEVGSDHVAVCAYSIIEGELQSGGVNLNSQISKGKLNWKVPNGDWTVWTFTEIRKPGTLNPLLPDSGATVVRDFFQEFENHNPGQSSKGLNYFFNDELHLGADKFAWNKDFAEEFLIRKGYDLFEELHGMWNEIGDVTPKIRMDYADVRMSLMEERYFKPIYTWHASRGIIFGCDSGGRGTKPHEFGDYFRATRWYSAPGHDTPGGNADLIKGKVSSSVANLYQQPRVWLEGYHSMGWGATPEQLMFATRENYLYGCTLLNLHGLYYTTYGSYWEWAPPCYHFHMPYWDHMDEFLGYFDRLSYLMSQGHHVADVAVIYPVAPYEAETEGEAAKNTAFDLARKLMAAGINFDFIDNDSLARAVVKDGRLVVENANTSYQSLVFPNMDAVRWESIEKGAEFAKKGGHVMVVGALPKVSDRAGRNDKQLDALNEQAFKPDYRFKSSLEVVDKIKRSFILDVRGADTAVRALHRKVGFRDVYMVMDATPGTVAEFRAKGAVELWDPWTGDAKPLHVVEVTSTGTKVTLPLEKYEAQIVVFTPGQTHKNPQVEKQPSKELVLSGPWTASFKSTMDNRYGDFRLPVTSDNKMIGVEARRFSWAQESEAIAKVAMLPETDTSNWEEQLHGFGPKFYQLGPIPESLDPTEIDKKLAKIDQVDPAVPIVIDGKSYHWKPYSFSWRYGNKDDSGHQGYHGLKGVISDDFIRMGKISDKSPGVKYVAAEAHKRYYLWSSAVTKAETTASVFTSVTTPAVRNGSPIVVPKAIYVNGKGVEDFSQSIKLKSGSNSVLIRYDDFGQSHVVLRDNNVPVPNSPEKLAMRWYKDPGVIPFDIQSKESKAEWFRFLSVPGTSAIQFDTMSKEPAQAWIDGKPMTSNADGRFEISETMDAAVVVAIRVVPNVGCSGGSAIPEPVIIETSGYGIMPLGDWSEMGVLNNYSGGVRYRKVFTLSEQDLSGRVELDLGEVTATAEVAINGQKVGVRVAPPWRFDLSDSLKVGKNEIEVLVLNTLSNHYQTIPSSYRGDPKSGLIGPVKVLCFESK